MKPLAFTALIASLFFSHSCTTTVAPREKPFVFSAKNIEDTALIAVRDRELKPHLKYASINAIEKAGLYYVTISSRPTIPGETYTVIINENGVIQAYSKGGYRTTPPTPKEIADEQALKLAQNTSSSQ